MAETKKLNTLEGVVRDELYDDLLTFRFMRGDKLEIDKQLEFIIKKIATLMAQE